MRRINQGPRFLGASPATVFVIHLVILGAAIAAGALVALIAFQFATMRDPSPGVSPQSGMRGGLTASGPRQPWERAR